jgi:hypothetical protein
MMHAVTAASEGAADGRKLAVRTLSIQPVPVMSGSFGLPFFISHTLIPSEIISVFPVAITTQCLAAAREHTIEQSESVTSSSPTASIPIHSNASLHKALISARFPFIIDGRKRSR